MKRIYLIITAFLFMLTVSAQDFDNKKAALFQFPLEFEIQNDQGEMETREYLKQYGTKGKTRAMETMYEIMLPFIIERFGQAGVDLLPCEELSSVKSNAYGIPNMMINKAVKSCEKADYFIKVAIKDITVINPNASQSDLSVKTRTINIRCRINILTPDKETVKSLEATFNSSEKIDPKRNIGIDIRKITGSIRDQELKIYEACFKMAFLKALDQL